MKSTAFSKIGAFALVFFALCLYLSVNAAAAPKTVKVGCVDIDNFLKVDGEGSASGYGAEYLNKIATITGWSYEYKQGSWEDCLQWIKSGEIDLLMPAEYSEDRIADYLFSEVECCIDYVALVGRKDDSSYYYDEYAAFDGMKIGMISVNYLNGIFEKYAEENNFAFTPVYYKSGTALAAALAEKKVDAIVNGNMEFTSEQKVLAKIEYMPAYFMMSVNNAELMDELNAALHKIVLHNPYYTADLYRKYYESIERQSMGFTRQEAEYVEHKGEITVMLNKNSYPVEWYDESEGSCKGMYVDILRLIERESGLRFRFVVNDTDNPAWQEVKNGEADVYGSAFAPSAGAPMNGLTYSLSYYECGYSLVGRKEKTVDLSAPLTIGVLKNNTGVASIIKRYYPLWNVVNYNSVEECLEGVRAGNSDLAAINFWNLSVDKTLLDGGLIIIDSSAIQLPVCISVPQSANPMLVSVLDKSILKITDREIQGCALNSVISASETDSFRNFIRRNPQYVVGAASAVAFVIASVLFMAYRSAVQKKQNSILQLKNKELAEAVAVQEELRKQAQTDALTGLKNKSTIEHDCQIYLNKHRDASHAIMVMDIDNFKNINDTYGHLCGDAILKHFGGILRKTADGADIVGRIGGDEFVMFIADIGGVRDVEARIGMLYKAMEIRAESFESIPIECSIGVTISGGGQMNYNELFLKADTALYRAKNEGKNRHIIA